MKYLIILLIQVIAVVSCTKSTDSVADHSTTQRNSNPTVHSALTDLSITWLKETMNSVDEIQTISILDPTCHPCIDHLDDVTKSVQNFSNSSMRNYYVWSPVLATHAMIQGGGDVPYESIRNRAVAIAERSQNQQSIHLWDPKLDLGQLIGTELKIGKQDIEESDGTTTQVALAWDITILFKGKTIWTEEGLVQPVFWMAKIGGIPEANVYSIEQFDRAFNIVTQQ